MKALIIFITSMALPVLASANVNSASVEVMKTRAEVTISGKSAEKLFNGMTDSLEKEQIETSGVVIRSGKSFDCIKTVETFSTDYRCFISIKNISVGEI